MDKILFVSLGTIVGLISIAHATRVFVQWLDSKVPDTSALVTIPILLLGAYVLIDFAYREFTT